MDRVVSVIYDGEVFRPEVSPGLEPNTRYDIIIKDVSSSSTPHIATTKKINQFDTQTNWKQLEDLIGTVEEPEDWALEHDHYLYGTPRSNDTETADND